MYKFNREKQFSLEDFDQPLGLKMDTSNRWVIKASMIPWDTIEDEYAKLFPSKTGMPAKPLRIALGSLLIQKQYGFSDEELVEQIKENPYYQYFIGLSGYSNETPFVPSLMVEFRKRLDENALKEISELIIEYGKKQLEKTDDQDDDNHDDDDNKGDGSGTNGGTEETTTEALCENRGTLMLDATCAPQYVEFPQDINLLNEVREKLEGFIDQICNDYGFKRPRMYRINARKDYLALAKCKKRSVKKIRKAIGKQLRYSRRNFRYLNDFLVKDEVRLSEKETMLLEVLRKVYDQQLYMYENRTHSVENRIVSISQPYIRPIVRGKAKSPVEFGAKLDLSVDENGMARIEKLSFDAYNEAEILKIAAENYRERTGHYPERILADQIYRNRENMRFCSENGIRLSGKKLGRPKKDEAAADRKTEYQDNTDRIEVERKFSLAKRKFGLGTIMSKREDTTKSSIYLSVIAMNLDRLATIFLYFIISMLFETMFSPKKLSFYDKRLLLEN